MAFFFTRRRRRSAWMRVAAVFMTVIIVSSNAASADRTFPVRQYEDGTIAIVSNHAQITGKRTAFRGDVWLSKINGGKGAYLMETLENTRKLNETLVSIKAQLRGGGCVGNNTKSALFNFTTHEYFNCTCKWGWGGEDCTVPNYSQLGEGECLQSDGSYPIKFSIGYGDLRPHTTGTNAQQAVDRCKAKCIVFAWCLAAELVFLDYWPEPHCHLVTDWNAYVVESTNTLQTNKWGGQQMIDGEYYQTYCNGGQAKCSDSNVFNGGSLRSDKGYQCYVKIASAPPAPLPPPPSPPTPPPPPPDPDYSYLGEGECRMANGQYPISFSAWGTGLSECKDLCLQYKWCLAVEKGKYACALITDTEAFITTGQNKFTDENDQWGATRTFDGRSYQTYCGGSGQAGACTSVTYEFGGGKLNSRSEYHCYVRK